MTTKTPRDHDNPVALADVERFMAFLDGQLGAAEALEIETELARDPAARDRLDKMRHDSLMLRAAFDESLADPLPERVLQTLEAATYKAPGAGKKPSWFAGLFSQSSGKISWPLALGGAMATFLFGLFVSYQLLDARISREFAAFTAMQEQDRTLRNAALAAALEEYVSGQSASWHNPESGNRGEITPIRTFKNPEGTWCREYDRLDSRGALKETRRAVACRRDDGRWETMVEILRDS